MMKDLAMLFHRDIVEKKPPKNILINVKNVNVYYSMYNYMINFLVNNISCTYQKLSMLVDLYIPVIHRPSGVSLLRYIELHSDLWGLEVAYTFLSLLILQEVMLKALLRNTIWFNNITYNYYINFLCCEHSSSQRICWIHALQNFDVSWVAASPSTVRAWETVLLCA